MQLIPALKIGLWNAWILMALLYTAGFIPLFINKEKVEKRGEGEPDWSQLNRNSRITFVITHIMIMPFTLIYSIFLPLELGSSWFIPGLIVFILGFLCDCLKEFKESFICYTSSEVWISNSSLKVRCVFERPSCSFHPVIKSE